VAEGAAACPAAAVAPAAAVVAGSHRRNP